MRDSGVRTEAVAGGGAVTRGFNGDFDEQDTGAGAPFGMDWDCDDDGSCEAMEEACRNGEHVSMFREYHNSSAPRWCGIDAVAPEPSRSADNADDGDRKAPTLDEPANEETVWVALAALQDMPSEDIISDEVHDEVKRAVLEMDAIVNADFDVGRP
jgi:hypothetical protein